MREGLISLIIYYTWNLFQFVTLRTCKLLPPYKIITMLCKLCSSAEICQVRVYSIYWHLHHF